jgi:hypothetical protein
MARSKDVLRVGVGASFADDRNEPAVDLAARGKLDYLVVECLAERTRARENLIHQNDPARVGDDIAELIRKRSDLPLMETAEPVASILPRASANAFADIARGPATRYELPRLCALKSVIERALGGGVTRSLAQDAHGSSLTSLAMTIEHPGGKASPCRTISAASPLRQACIPPSRQTGRD